MKKLILSAFAITAFVASTVAQSFVSPIGFVQTDAGKEQVLAFIRKQVKEDCDKIGMSDPSTLRLMEKQNLDAFKELTKATNTTLLKSVIDTYCGVGMCNYYTIMLMYNKQNADSNKKTEW